MNILKWSKKELEYLKKNYALMDNKVLSIQLKRPVYAIVAKANKSFGLKKLKFCRICGKNITKINRNAVVCKCCSEEYNRNYKKEWNLKNKDKLISQWKTWREHNKGRKKENDRLWRLNNKEKKAMMDKNWYEKTKKIRNALLDIKCIDCGHPLKNLKYKRCEGCGKKHRTLYQKNNRKNNKLYYNALNRKYRKEKRVKENKRRLKLGLPLIGKHFRREMELLVYIKSFFPNEKIIVHDRSTLGQNLELDIFIPRLKLAFEYHGRQHFEFWSTHYWKNYTEFKDQQLRDQIKKRLCAKLGINLIEITCYEKLSESLVLTKLNENKLNNVQSALLKFSKLPEIEIKSE